MRGDPVTGRRAEDDPDSIASIAITPRMRLEKIETALMRIDEKLDIRFDAVELRLTKVESTQAGQASTAEFVKRASELADEASKKAATLAEEATKLAATLAKEATTKAIALADEQKKLDGAVTFLTSRLDAFDRKLAWYGGAGAVLVAAAGFVGHYIH